MGNANNQLKELVNEAIHNHFHDYTETEMILKDWLYGICEQLDEYEVKAKAYNDTLEKLDKLTNNDERDKEARSNDFVAGMLIAYEKIFDLMEDYIKESGESE